MEFNNELPDTKTDLEIAQLILEPTGTRYKSAPYAYQKNGQVRFEFRDLVKSFFSLMRPSESNLQNCSPYGWDFDPEDQEVVERARAQFRRKAQKDFWRIQLVAAPFKPLFECNLCKADVPAGAHTEHVRAKHEGMPRYAVKLTLVGYAYGSANKDPFAKYLDHVLIFLETPIGKNTSASHKSPHEP